MNDRIDLDPVEVGIQLDGGNVKKIFVSIYKEKYKPGIFFEVFFKHESGSHTDAIAGGGIDSNSLQRDIEKKLKKYFEYDCPSFRVVHHKDIANT